MQKLGRISLSLAGGVLLLGAAAANATIYTQDPNIAHFTAGISNYATFSNFSAGDVGSPFTPSSAELAANGFRVFAGGSLPGLSPTNNWNLGDDADRLRPRRAALASPGSRAVQRHRLIASASFTIEAAPRGGFFRCGLPRRRLLRAAS